MLSDTIAEIKLVDNSLAERYWRNLVEDREDRIEIAGKKTAEELDKYRTKVAIERQKVDVCR